nr:hypothetical protein [Tanacetum cinerariifolium]
METHNILSLEDGPLRARYMEAEDVQEDAQNEEVEVSEPRSQAHPSPPPVVVGPSDTKTEDIQQIQNDDCHEPQSLADPAAAPEPVPS